MCQPHLQRYSPRRENDSADFDNDQRTIQIEGVYLSLPCVVGCGGVEKIVELPLDDDERQGLRNSADLLKRTLSDLNNSAGLTEKN